jgi:nudix-type nucleoside diphosphatase (YffH/AdpP family)
MNERVRITDEQLLSDSWYILKKYTFDYQLPDGTWTSHQREAYDRGNGVVMLLYNRTKKTVILTRQFRLPILVNDHPDGMLIEAPAGLLDESDPAAGVIRETEEETGYEVHNVRKIMEVYMSPGSVTEKLYFFVAEYSGADRVSDGGGADEQEDIEVLEIPFFEAMRMIESGDIADGKTIILLQYAALHGLLA